MEDAGVLDRQLIAELRDIMGAEFPVLVQAYLRDAAVRLEELRDLTQAQSAPHGATDAAEGVRRAAHTLKGSSSNLGAVEVARLCAELEDRARRQVVVADRLLSDLEAAMRVAAAALTALLTEQD
ncbi:Hpt domain-containing protein [Isoalcanivorax indicus]|uniref:Hpt domain-containing protein n=1 Tax=Isoalcanivorax indicus TaxID=2202653 RepID=UPI000DBA1910|nr:Hpt domain-containing protein [Isoalcanivorax indicus]